ncbi:hypothetical protein Q5H91_13340 [Sphingomonas sp. KR1UV-12]|uniref:Outer membrane protein beta-barrel domain-containing protein n=1 Tax=Sphingomonas aurea TaxID=3063994 RepID=A0ABT9EMM1_9SPHN|nr:hypothetical protein [Sphingomonas sp. KR1UV-12]MDP1028202.1 hypothetical protein [Sphingomonas sp. KR1UV-12]
MRRYISAVLTIAGLLVSAPAVAQQATDADWSKFKLGAGLSFTLDVGKLDRISEAVIVDGKVRVTHQNNGRARIMLEGHHFFASNSAKTGVGPFIAVQPGSSEIIEAIGMGVMIGFRHNTKSTQSFNIGVGIVLDPNTRVLGDGFRENQPPPGNETEVRYRETLQTGILVLTSFSF